MGQRAADLAGADEGNFVARHGRTLCNEGLPRSAAARWLSLQVSGDKAPVGTRWYLVYIIPTAFARPSPAILLGGALRPGSVLRLAQPASEPGVTTIEPILRGSRDR